MPDLTSINKFLKEFETNFRGEPIYKVVYGPSQTEIRKGTFTDYSSDGTIFLRQVTESREVLKYDYIGERYILEKWFSPEKVINDELPLSIGGSYEPFFVFESNTGMYAEPTLKLVEFIVTAASRGLNKMTPGQRKEYYEKIEEREEIKIRDSLDEDSILQSYLHSGEGIGYTKELKETKDFKEEK